MLVQLFMGLVTDLVFGSVKAMRHSFDAEIGRYFEERGLQATRTTHTPAR